MENFVAQLTENDIVEHREKMTVFLVQTRKYTFEELDQLTYLDLLDLYIRNL